MTARRISFSNIAWELPDEPAAARLLLANGIDAVDVAPGKYFPDPLTATEGDALRARDWWLEQGIEVLGMQALLFGVQGLNLFGEPAGRAALLERLAAVAQLGEWMGATRLVFGSPRNRDRGALDDAQVLDVAVPFFRTLGERAGACGVTFCLEPNPPRYACNFMTSTDGGAAIVAAIGHPAIRLHLDAGTLAILDEDPEEQVARHRLAIGYVHASEPDLAPLAPGGLHDRLGAALDRHLPSMPVSIEMRAAGLPAVASAARAVRAAYAGASAR